MLLIKNGEPNLAYAPFILPQVSEIIPELPEEETFEAAMEPERETFDAMEPDEAIASQVELAAMEEEAAEVIEEARAEAERIIAGARANVEEIERAAREKAILEARSTIAKEIAVGVTAAVESLRAQLSQSIEEVVSLREQIAAYGEREMVQLALEIAKKVVRREATVDREIVVSLARVALARLHNRALAVVHLHPDDFQYVLAHRERLGAGNTVKLVEDASISRGGCLIETDLGDVDARIEHQFGEIERGFLHDKEA